MLFNDYISATCIIAELALFGGWNFVFLINFVWRGPNIKYLPIVMLFINMLCNHLFLSPV